MPAKQVGQLLKELATDLGNTGLPMQQQHWVLFSVLGAYFYYNDSLEDDMRPGDEETDAVPMRLRQVLHHTLQVCQDCADHIHPIVVSAEFADMAADVLIPSPTAN